MSCVATPPSPTLDEDAANCTVPWKAGASAAVLARDAAGCDLVYSPGTLQRAALLSARLELSRDGERVVLLHQSHVVNAP